MYIYFIFRWQSLFQGLFLYSWWCLLFFVENIVKKNCRKNMPLKQPKPSVNGPKRLSLNASKLRIALFQVHLLKSLTSKATPRQSNFLKGLTKLAILPKYKHPMMLCLTLPLCQKSGLILVRKCL